MIIFFCGDNPYSSIPIRQGGHMKALSLFSGIGGIDLAAEWAGIETVAFCEREPFPQRVLRKHWPDVPIYDDVCTLTKERLEADGIGAIELIHGGYPCQPFSNAGKRRGKEDDRHLWPEVRRLIASIRPRWFVGENVAGHVTLGLDDVLSDLEALGYAARAFILPASSVGAPHRRDRVFIVGYAESFPKRGLPCGAGAADSRPACSSENVADSEGKRCGEAREHFARSEKRASRCRSDVADSSSSSRQQKCNATTFTSRSRHSSRGDNAGRSIRTVESRMGRVLDGLSARMDGFRWPAGRGQQQYDWEPPRVKSGVKQRVGRLKGLGNAVVPAQIYPILAAIKAIDDQLRL